MDSNLTTAGLSAGAVALVGMLWKVLQNVNHRRVVSKCCGRRLEMSFDVGESSLTPEGSQNPPPPLLLKKDTVVGIQPATAPAPPSNPSGSKIASMRDKAPSQQSEADTSVPALIVPATSEARAIAPSLTLPQQVAEHSTC